MLLKHLEGILNYCRVPVRFGVVEAVNGNIKAAAARIDTLLEDQTIMAPGSPTVQVHGYTWMTCYRESRVRLTEVDDVDPSIRWFRRGGNYRIQFSVT